jgi:UDP-glucose:(heptosyl)LPS alpha-1,3-glucosyltransferase
VPSVSNWKSPNPSFFEERLKPIMHIALVRRCYSLKKAGAERYCVNLSRQLQRLGHRVTIIGETIDPELRDQIEFIPVQVNHFASWTKNRSFADNVQHVVKQHRFDIVHGLSRTPAVDTFRVTDPLQAHWVNVFYRNRVVRFLQHLNPRHRTIFNIERSVFQSPNVRRYITQSKLDSRLLTEYYGVPEEKIVRVSNGVDTSTFHPGVRSQGQAVREELGIEPGQPLLVFASMDFRRKGLGPLLKSIATCRTKDVRLLVLGNGDEKTYGRMARDLGLTRHVIFAGRQSNMARYYGAGDLFVLPTIYEPFPNVNLEAMACGLPVLTSATAGGADIIQPDRNGYLLSHPEAVPEMAEYIDRHLSLSERERQEMAAACWQTAQGMTAEQNARNTVRVFEDVLREKAG